MTEHETLLRLQYMYDSNNPFMCGRRKEIETAMNAIKELEQYRAIGTVEEIKALSSMEIHNFNALQKYRAIGTIEEFKALKENQRRCEDCAGCTTWKCDCANIRANAIDEFAKRMSLEIYESNIWDVLATANKNSSLSDTSDKIVDYVIDTAKKIAEQLKGGAE